MDSTEARPGHAALRRGRFSTPGHAYLLTFTTAGRHPFFSAPRAAMTGARALADARLWDRSRCMAWVLMPDHVHLLVELGDESLPALVGRIKTNTARRVRESDPDIPRVWARGYHDWALRSEDSIRGVARYVVLNPVRAGLVARVGDYPFWDAVWI